MDNIQKYWGIYLKALDAEVQKELDANIKAVMDEINAYIEQHGLIEDN